MRNSEEKLIDDIKLFTKNNPVVNNFDKMLIQLIKSYNFGPFYLKLKKIIENEQNKDKISYLNELRAAYYLKTKSKFDVHFMPEKEVELKDIPYYGSGMIFELPNGVSLKNLKAKSKPDLFWFFKGKVSYCEIKTIKTNLKSIIAELSDEEFDFDKESTLVSKKILGEFRNGAKQILKYGQGIVYIFCEKPHINFEFLKKEILDIFNNNKKIMNLILTYREISSKKMNQVTTIEKTIIFSNPYFDLNP